MPFYCTSCGPVLALFLSALVAQADDSNRLSGIDLSHHNEVSDWAEIKADGVSIVILKATDGVTYIDPKFSTRFAAVQSNGFVRGAYHFYETNDAPNDQADWFIKNVQLVAGDLPPIIDIERIKDPIHGELPVEFNIFLQRLEDHYGARPIIYTGPNFWDHALKEHLPDYPLWVAHYGAKTPSLPQGWDDWTMWQYSESTIVAGTSGPVDGSFFNGDENALKAVLLADE